MAGNYFVALPVRAPGLIECLRDGAPDGLRWFHPHDLHLTLAFFGKEDPERLPALRQVLAGISFPAARVTLGKLLTLPHRRRFSALAFDLSDGRDEIAEVIARWRGPLGAAAGIAPDTRPPLPHLTVARPRRNDLHRDLIVAWADRIAPPPGPVEVLPPAIFGWSSERPRLQFRVME